MLLMGYGLWDARNTASGLREELADTSAALATERLLRAADQRAVASTQAKLKALRAQKGKADADLKTAVEAEPDWANQRIPDAVLDALRVHSADN